MMSPSITTGICRALAAALVGVLVACGGGGVGSGGTGGPQGLSVGTVSGLGSVIVDGVRFDTNAAPIVEEVAPGQDSPADAQLGDRVEVQFEQAGVAASVRVETTLVGPVSAVGGGSFTALGQTVQVNTASTSGPVTQFAGGIAAVTDLAQGDEVRVHGAIEGEAGAYVVRATRVERLTAAPAWFMVTGLVGELGNGGSAVFKLGALTVDAHAATVVPAGAALANGELVKVMAAPAPLAGLQMSAAQVRVKSLPKDAGDTTLGGAISGLDTTARTFQIGAVTVSYASATVLPSTSALANGRYVRARGTLAADGTLVASSVTLRDGQTETEAELHGTISNTDAVGKTFVIRDVTVDASGVTPEGCSGGIVDGLYAEVEGHLESTRLVATAIHCEGEPSGATIEREGQASAVDTTAKTFTLTTSTQTLTVSWSTLTYFNGLGPDTLSTSLIKVEGVMAGNVLNASKIEREN